MNYRFPQPDEHCKVVGLPTIAVDLGFGARKSCGLAWQTPGGRHQTRASYFAECVTHVAKFASDHPEIVLIVEAPLSGLFDPAGNPVGRVRFEKDRINDKTVTRYWYVGAGGAIGLGAILFFSRLSELTMQDFGTINVVEGFVSFKTQRSKDVEDARALLEGFHNPATAKLHRIEPNDPEGRAVNMLGVARLVSSEEPCPMVIVVTVEDLSQKTLPR